MIVGIHQLRDHDSVAGLALLAAGHAQRLAGVFREIGLVDRDGVILKRCGKRILLLRRRRPAVLAEREVRDPPHVGEAHDEALELHPLLVGAGIAVVEDRKALDHVRLHEGFGAGWRGAGRRQKSEGDGEGEERAARENGYPRGRLWHRNSSFVRPASVAAACGKFVAVPFRSPVNPSCPAVRCESRCCEAVCKDCAATHNNPPSRAGRPAPFRRSGRASPAA